MSEQELLNKIIIFAKRRGLLVFHTYVGYQVTEVGYFDLTIFSEHSHMFRELKRNLVGAMVPLEQARWMRMARKGGADAGIWTEDDWHCGRIQAELERLAFPVEEAA